MRYFDLHCDTAYEMENTRQSLASNSLNVALDKAAIFENYSQIMAIWSDEKLSDEDAYLKFKQILENLNREIKQNSSLVGIAKTSNDVLEHIKNNRSAFILSVEDARLLCEKTERLNELYSLGVRFLTPTWKGINIIGGAFDTNVGLTDFGKNIIRECFKLGIIPDISHSSQKTSEEIFELSEEARKPIVATHSCSYSVYSHERNLRNSEFEFIRDKNGIVGISLCRYHLTDKSDCTIDDIIKHVDKYLSLGGENTVCIGADMDGAPMPDGINGINDIYTLGNRLSAMYSEDIANKIMWKNAVDFLKSNL